MVVILETERLRLREMVHTDASRLMEIFADPEAMKYYPSTKNRAEALQWIEWTLENYRKYNVGMWIVEQKETGTFLGQCGIVPQKIDGIVEMEIGYLIARDLWGNGYATEAATACKNHAFNELDIKRIISLIDNENIPSKKVAERVGMIYEKDVQKWQKTIALYSVST